MKHSICQVCKKEFSFYGNKSPKYCSRKCYFSVPKIKQGYNLECAICNTTFYVEKSSRQKCCSKYCGDIYQTRAKLTIKCKICDKVFTKQPSLVKLNRGKYCSLSCRDADPEVKLRLLNQSAQQMLAKPNKLEVKLYTDLEALQIKYIPQYIVNDKFTVDAYLPDVKIVIQVDGDYWHGNSEIYKVLNSVQQKRKNYDKSQDAYMDKIGIKVIRFWESDIKLNPNLIIEKLRDLNL